MREERSPEARVCCAMAVSAKGKGKGDGAGDEMDKKSVLAKGKNIVEDEEGEVVRLRGLGC